MRIALLQLDVAWEDVKANHGRAAKRLEEAASRGARLAILPEMFCTGFSMDTDKVAQPPGGPTETWLKAMARGLDLHLLAGLPQQCGTGGNARPQNVALLVSPEGDVERYAKIHPFSPAGEAEKYQGGDRVLTAEVEGLRLTPLVCYDLRFPEPFRLAAEETDLYAVIASWPDKRRAHWQTLLKARAIENLAYVAGVNRVGEGDGLNYAGDSAVISPWGETLVSAAEDEALLLCDVEPRRVEEARAKFPFLKDRRPEAYRR